MQMRDYIVPAVTALAMFAALPALAEPPIHESTRRDLEDAMKGEAFAYLKYLSFAEQARKDGRPDIAEQFEKTAKVKRGEHFAEHAKLAGLVRSDAENLSDAIKGENYETMTMYPDMAKRASAAGDLEVAKHFEEVAGDEAKHRDQFKAAIIKIERK
jgi:rubrerythrin